jgi:hypothetical protein
MTPLVEWVNFYVIVGSSAGALIGLQFVAMTLIASMPVARSTMVGKAFATPTIVHFAAVLMLSALISAPWHELVTATVVWALFGLAGILYIIVVARRMRVQTDYKPEFEDWLFHCLLPLAAYALLAASALAARSHLREALFGIGGTALLLLLVGIHNTWDAVLYYVFTKKQ